MSIHYLDSHTLVYCGVVERHVITEWGLVGVDINQEGV
jgi:hypothetical protein